jgi:hypothetical protein
LALKIPQLLVQYLYKNRRMPLPGLGIFTLDKSIVLPEADDRALLAMPNAVQFQNANIAAADKDLISFICENTGKITPLAISDLDSYLNLGTEMLNIGKPFHLEGIGTISKNKTGKFDFTPGEYSLIRESASSPDHEKKKIYAKEKKQMNTPVAPQNRNLLVLGVIIVALFIVGWGGWLMYKKSSPPVSGNDTAAAAVGPQQIPSPADSTKKDSVSKDSAKAIPVDSVHPGVAVKPGIPYKFIILETNDKPRAMRRYNQLISFQLKAHYYHKDSTYKVFFEFPALNKDTIRIKDSLRREYAHDITIEPQ